MVVVQYVEPSGDESDDGMFFRVDPLLLPGKNELPGHLRPDDDQHTAENIEKPCKTLDQSTGGKDKYESHDDCSQDAPEENPLEVFRVDIERHEYQHDDEYIVDRKGIFDKIAGKVFERKVVVVYADGLQQVEALDADRVAVLHDTLAELLQRICSMNEVAVKPDQKIEKDRDTDPNQGPVQRLAE